MRRVPLELRVDLRDHSCLLREVRSPLSLPGAPWDALKGEFRGLSRVAARNRGFPRLVTVTSGSFSLCLLEVRNTLELGGALGTPLGLVQWKSDSSRFEAGTSGFLSFSDVGLGLCMPFQT